MHVAFDIGNVLAEVKLEKFSSEFVRMVHADPIVFLNRIQAYQDIGLTTVEQALRIQFPAQFSDNSSGNDNVEYLLKAWNDTVIPNEMMLNFMDNLRSEGVKIALLSNMGQEHATYLRNACPRMFQDTAQHLSFEVGARKPSKLYYQSFLMDHNEWVGAVYLDDRDENLVTGKKYSFKSFKFDLEQILKLPKGHQKAELNKIRSYIFDRKYDKLTF